MNTNKPIDIKLLLGMDLIKLSSIPVNNKLLVKLIAITKQGDRQ